MRNAKASASFRLVPEQLFLQTDQSSQHFGTIY